jgi:DUF971 family protein
MGGVKPAIQPLSIKAPHGAREMQVQWSDGHQGVYPHGVLREACPCAVCRERSQPEPRRNPVDLELRDIRTVGNYAIELRWGDGHDSGIYDFAYLRSLCQCGVCREPTL